MGADVAVKTATYNALCPAAPSQESRGYEPSKFVRDLRAVVPLLNACDRIPKCADSGDADFYDVAVG